MSEVTRRRCIFCGGADLTKEDVIPLWISELFASDFRHTKFQMGGGHLEGPQQDRKTLGFDSATRAVCQGCNNGWMSDLEGEAKPILTPLIKGNACRLSAESHQVLARWIFKTVAMCEHTGSQNKYFTSIELEALKTKRELPAGTMIWIAYRPTWHYAIWAASRGFKCFDKKESSHLATAYVVVMAIGALVFQVCFYRWDQPSEPFKVLRLSEPTWSGHAAPIWPSEAALSWPPAEVLTDEALQPFFLRFGPPIPPLAPGQTFAPPPRRTKRVNCDGHRLGRVGPAATDVNRFEH